MSKAEEIVARGRATIGVRFRPQGRSAATGLDCVGVAALAMGVEAVTYYNLRSSDADEVNSEFSDCGFLRIAPTAAEAGDLLLTRIERGQLHVVILTPDGYLHADARLRRVAEVPGDVPWPVVSAWRHPDHEARPDSKRQTH